MLKFTHHHRFFDDLVTLLCSLASLGVVFDAQRTGLTHTYTTNDYITIEGNPRVSRTEFRFFPHSLMAVLIANKWPTQIVFETLPVDKQVPAHPLWLTGLQGVHGSMAQSAFMHYFETVRPNLETTYGTNTSNWPASLDFARVVRNAFAHGGKINFQNLNAAHVHWKTLTYSPSDNGRQILYQDMTTVELILLMEEIDSLI